jgi:choice-of-anchor C domain-containing protein
MWDRRIISFLLVTMLSVVVSLGQSQLDNGGFENAAVNPGGSYSSLGPDDKQITGWIVGGNGIDYIGTYWKPSEGSRSIDLSLTDNGTISTTLNTVPGTTYQLYFDMAGNPDGGPDEKALRVWIDDKYRDFTFNIKGKTRENMGWVPKTLEFTATTSSTLLKFEGMTNTAWGPAIDNVIVTPPGFIGDSGGMVGGADAT